MEEKERQNKNAEAFGGQQVPSSKLPDKEEIPYEDIPLPSNGVIYEPGTALHNRKDLPIKVMTAEEEDILTSPSLVRKGTALDELLKSCVLDKNVDIKELIAGDRNSLMVGLRIVGYGPDYPAEVMCSDCGETYENMFDLSKLEIKRLDIDPVKDGQNLFEYTLPVSKEKVLFKFLTGKDEDDIELTNKRLKKTGIQSQEKNVTDKLRHCVVKISDCEKQHEINRKIRKMRAMDSRALRQYMQKHEPGIDMKQEVTCPSCDYVEEVQIPVGIAFFYPSAPE